MAEEVNVRDQIILIGKLKLIRDILQILLLLLFRLQLVIKVQFALVKARELVDLVLILSANLDLICACGGLVLFGELSLC